MIKMANLFGLSEERDAFIFMFVQFSGLDLIQNRELTKKNNAFIFSLLDLGSSFPNYLQEGWKLILNSALKLEWLYPLYSKQGSAKRLKNKKEVFQNNINHIFDNISIEQIMRVYASTTMLNEASLIKYLECLCEIMKEKTDKD
jgi:hypothetical protein